MISVTFKSIDMPLFEQYQPSSLRSREYILRTLRLGLIPIAVTVLLMVERPRPPGPGLWSALGIALGMEIMLYSAWRMRRPDTSRTRLGRRMAESMDLWFPLLMFTAQSGFLIVTVLVFWLTLLELGLQIYRWTHLVFLTLLFYIPVRRFALACVKAKPEETVYVVRELLNYVAAILLTLLTGAVLTMVLIPLGHPDTGDASPSLIAVWVLVVIAVLSFSILFVDRVFSSRKRRLRTQ